jgi:hypothetical protein
MRILHTTACYSGTVLLPIEGGPEGVQLEAELWVGGEQLLQGSRQLLRHHPVHLTLHGSYTPIFLHTRYIEITHDPLLFSVAQGIF